MPILQPRYRYTRFIAEGAPETPGLYALWEEDELVYLGRASGETRIRSRLLEHLAANLCPQATHYSRELTLQAAAREAELLDDFRRQFGRLPRHNGAQG